MRPKTILIFCSMYFALSCTSKRVPEGAAIRVGDEWIYKKEVNYIAQLMQSQASKFSAKAVIEGIGDNVRKNAARQLLAERLMIREAKRRNITVSSARLDSAVEKFKNRAGGEAAFTRMLTQSGNSEGDFIKQMKSQLLVDSLVQSVLLNVDTVDLVKCKNYYDKHKDKFRQRQKIRASQILFTLPDDISMEKKAEIRKKAEEVRQKANKSKDFTGLAVLYSQGSNAKSGGDIGWVEKGDMKPEIDAVIFSLNKNEVSDVVESDIGLHIFKKTDEKMSDPKHFHEVAQGIKTTLELKSKNDEIMRVVDSLMAAADIEYIDTTLKM